MIDRSPLTTYGHDKQVVAEALRAVQRYLEERRRELAHEVVRGLLSRLAEDRFNLVVVGQFKRGKSSLVNALLGQEILPTSIVPLTSIITAVRYGLEERALVSHEGSTAVVSVPVSALVEYVTELGNPNNEKHVTSVDVEVPSSFLRRGLHVVDTPGVGSVYQANTATTYAFLPEADAVVFVTSVESPLTETELVLADTVRQYVHRVFFVLNKTDQVGPADRQEAIAFAERLLHERMGTDHLKIFPVSAKLALEGKRAADSRQVEESGLAQFEAALSAFLVAERGRVLLVSLLERALRVLAEEEHLLDLAESGTRPTRGDSGEDVVVLGQYLDDLDTARRDLVGRLRRTATDWVSQVIAPAVGVFLQQVHASLSAELPRRIAETGGNAGDDRYQRVRAWYVAVLAERGRAFLAERRDDCESLAQQLLHEARQGLRKPSDLPNVPELVFSVGELVPTKPSRFDVDVGRLRLHVGQMVDEPLLLLPGPVADWALRRRLRQDLATDVAETARRMIGEVERYFEGAIGQIDRDTLRALVDLRHAVETARNPAAEPCQTPAGQLSTPNGQVAQARTLAELISRLTSLRDALVASPEGELPAVDTGVPTATLPSEGKATGPAPDDATTIPSSGVALQKSTCGVCATVRKAVWDYLCHWQYVLATDEATRRSFRADGGFCRRHTWELEAVANLWGICAGYPPVVERFAQDVAGLAGLPAPTIAERLRALLPGTTCRLCAFERQREAAALRELATALTTPDGRQAYRRSSGLCLPHVQALLAIGVGPAVTSLVLEEVVRHLDETAEAMRGYVVKVDARRRDLITPEEYGASRSALDLLVGDDRVTGRGE